MKRVVGRGFTMSYTVCVTGHRPDKLFGYNLYDKRYLPIAVNLRNIVLGLLKQYGEVHCIYGGALGIDQLFGLVVRKLKQQGYPVTLEVAIPCQNYTSHWKDTTYWDMILPYCDKETLVSDKPYQAKHMQLRNMYMVDHSDMVIAVYDGYSKGGTRNCINYAQSKGKQITYVQI